MATTVGSAGSGTHGGARPQQRRPGPSTGAGPGTSRAPPVPPQIPLPDFPTHNAPRVWLLTSALSPLAVRLMRQLLEHGDYVVACLPPLEFRDEQRKAEYTELMAECNSRRKDREGWKDRTRGISCDMRISSVQAAVHQALEAFGRIDILLLCQCEAVVGTVEELSTNYHTQSLVRSQFESVFFSQVHFIKAALPILRQQQVGHIIALTSTCGHLGTPGLSMYSAATWALEGYCDSLAYEVAPFNIKVTIVQPNMEVQALTNRLTFAPQILAYTDAYANAPSVRDIFANVLNSDPETAITEPPALTGDEPATPESTSLEPEMGQGSTFSRYPKLPPSATDTLVSETVHALTAIGGLENPPLRHIVGHEAAAAVKEKLQTVTEEMEEFVDASLAVDIFDSPLKEEAKRGKKPEESLPDADTASPGA